MRTLNNNSVERGFACHPCSSYPSSNTLQLEDGGTVLAEKQEDLGAPAVAAHIRSLTEPRSEEECQV